MTRQIQNSIDDFAEQSITQDSKSETLWLKQRINPEAIDGELLTKISHVKRFTERLHADPYFRKQVSTDPHQAVAHYSLKVDLEEIRPVWDTEFTKKLGEKVLDFPILTAWWEFDQRINSSRVIKSISTSLKEPHFKAWRERQIARTASQFKQSIYNSIMHFPVAFELSKGCSVGCHFCGVSAPRLGDIFFYNKENAQLWRKVLELIKEILGSAAGEGFCYWATDPLDNPDYEKFCRDFHDILGIFPPTTTALSMRDPARTRALLKLSRDNGCPLNRFSILSLKMFNQVHEEFSAEELAFVDLVLQNKESDIIKANTGRTREQNLKKREQDNESHNQGSIACVTGFLFNMVDRSVKLISPCNASDRWPLGYIVYDEGNFFDANDLKILLERIINDNMPLTVRSNTLINFREDLKYESLPDGFQLSNRLKTFKFRHEPYLKELGDIIHKGGKTAETIASMFESYGVSPVYIWHYFNLMLERAVLDNEPQSDGYKAKDLTV